MLHGILFFGVSVLLILNTCAHSWKLFKIAFFVITQAYGQLDSPQKPQTVAPVTSLFRIYWPICRRINFFLPFSYKLYKIGQFSTLVLLYLRRQHISNSVLSNVNKNDRDNQCITTYNYTLYGVTILVWGNSMHLRPSHKSFNLSYDITYIFGRKSSTI